MIRIATPERFLPRRVRREWRRTVAPVVISCAAAVAIADAGSVLTPADLKALSLEDLSEVRVTSVSKRPERLGDAASAIQVLTGESIRRSGATSLPEALRLAPNLQVAQVNASQWAISARGLNNVLANKLLVQIDGRSVYTPLYAGVFWDVQNVLLEDVERIEVISGPGGSLWGANAVNGVVNVTTKSASETHGLFVSGGGGAAVRHVAAARWGGAIGHHGHLRVYGMGFERDDTVLLDGSDAMDSWSLRQGGFRTDWGAGGPRRLTIQGDYYDGEPNPDGASPVDARGGNAIVRWEQTLSTESDLGLAAYYDRTHRDFGNGLREDVTTIDIDSQHRLPVGDRQELVYGVGFRWMEHDLQNLPLFGFFPAKEDLHLYSAFVQDAVTFRDGRVRATIGSKIEHHAFTGVEIQPAARLGWVVRPGHLAWLGVSRAVRAPSRIDRDFAAYAAPDVPVIQGNSEFDSEDLLALEGGWRVSDQEEVAGSVSVFHNLYRKLRSAEPGPPPNGLPITFDNGVEGTTSGIELAGVLQLLDHWRLRGGYTYLRKDLRTMPGSQDLNEASAESNDPRHQVLVQSASNLGQGITVDTVVRWVDALPDPYVPSHFGLDLRVAWATPWGLEIAATGRNLLEADHMEFVPASPSPRRIGRSGQLTLAFRRGQIDGRP